MSCHGSTMLFKYIMANEVSQDEQIQILKEFIINKMLEDGFEIKGTTLQSITEKAKKFGFDSEKVISVLRPVYTEAFGRAFTPKSPK